jgi:NADH dehydrogenase FAD-containing subunit
MTVLLRLDQFTCKGHRVTLISPSAYHYYSGMGPGMLSGMYEPREVRFHIRKMAEERGASYVEDSVVRIAPVGKIIVLASGGEIPYDVASFNTGSGVPVGPLAPPEDGTIIPVKPIINLYRARLKLLREIARRDLKIAVIGGGPAGVEVAANLWRLVRGGPHDAEITLVGGSRILGVFPDRVRDLALESLKKRNIRILEGIRAHSIEAGRVVLSDGATLPCDFIFLAVGVKPSNLFLDSGIPTGEDGGLLVNSFLQSTAHPELFGGGDCISLAGHPLAKVGVYAVRQNPVLMHNLMAALDGGPLRPFSDGGPYMLIMNMGDGKGILWKGNRVWNGRLSFLLKDFIDRRFMKTFQVSGEREETNEVEGLSQADA